MSLYEYEEGREMAAKAMEQIKTDMRNRPWLYSPKDIKKMREEEEIQKLISKMNLSPDSAAALNLLTTKTYTEFEEKGIMQKFPIRERVAVSTYLACDGKACVAIPKLIVVAHSIPMFGIRNARKILKIPRGTAHQKLDSLCHVCHINDTNVISRAHDYIHLFDLTGSAPTTIAAAALSAAANKSPGSVHHPSPIQKVISSATGVSTGTLIVLVDYIERKRGKRGNNRREGKE